MDNVLIEEMDLNLVENNIEEIREGISTTKKYYITGTYLVSNQINGNKRIYPKAVLEREVDRYIKDFINENRGLGELNHPTTTEINPERVSHMIKELKWDGDIVWGKSLVLDTPMGIIVKNLMSEGVKLGTSSRALGSLKNGIVQNDLRLVTPSDIVTSPSGPNCWLTGIHENKEWINADGLITEVDIEAIKTKADKIIIENRFSAEDKQAAFMKLFTDVMRKISTKK